MQPLLWPIIAPRFTLGDSKILPACTLPLTGKSVVDRIITNLDVLDIVEGGLKIIEVADGVTEAELRAATKANII